MNTVLLAKEPDPSVRDVPETFSISVDVLYLLQRQLRKNGEIETQADMVFQNSYSYARHLKDHQTRDLQETAIF